MRKREFANWCGNEIEKICKNNDHKPAWEEQNLTDLMNKVTEEYNEVYTEYKKIIREDGGNFKSLEYECADLATTSMMLASIVNPAMNQLKRGKEV